jgi:hypothetical protein
MGIYSRVDADYNGRAVRVFAYIYNIHIVFLGKEVKEA